MLRIRVLAHASRVPTQIAQRPPPPHHALELVIDQDSSVLRASVQRLQKLLRERWRVRTAEHDKQAD